MERNKSLRDLQSDLPWGAHAYGATYDADRRPHREFKHAVEHVGQEYGKLLLAIEALEHAAGEPGYDDVVAAQRPVVVKRLTYLLWNLLRAANEYPGAAVDLAAEFDTAVETKMGPKASK